MIAAFLVSPHLIWLVHGGAHSPSEWFATAARGLASLRIGDWLWLVGLLVVAHAGLILFVIIAVRAGRGQGEAPAIGRALVDDFAKAFVYFFAFVPVLLAAICAIVFNRPGSLWAVAPLIVLSSLAVILAGGSVIRLYHERVLAWTWLLLLLAPAVLTVAAIVLMPWTFGAPLRVTEPATEMGQFFNDSFTRRTGRPLAIVAGDERIASLIALSARDRPSALFAGSPWMSEKDIREKGAIVLWPATDTVGTPPAALRACFPDLVAEPPRAFERAIQGRMPLMRIGWAMIRPSDASKGQ
jgi:hypothetical protein